MLTCAGLTARAKRSVDLIATKIVPRDATRPRLDKVSVYSLCYSSAFRSCVPASHVAFCHLSPNDTCFEDGLAPRCRIDPILLPLPSSFHVIFNRTASIIR
jgi:hypothetical protein